MSFRIISHTADVGIGLEADNIESLFLDAAAGMFHVISQTKPAGDIEHLSISLESQDSESLLVDWLAELLFYFETRHFFYLNSDLKISDGRILSANVKGAIFDELSSGTEIKAVTHHLLEIKHSDRGFEAIVIFDL